jgi:Ca2+-binding EF-hand superfamily protein
MTTASCSSSAFSQLELQELRDSFAAFDIGNRGRIACGELRQVLESLYNDNHDAAAHQSTSPPTTMYPHLGQVLDLLNEFYKDDNDTIDFEGYLQLMERTTLQHRMLEAQQQEQQGDDDKDGDHGIAAATLASYAHVFELFDVDGKGYITVDDLERLAHELGEHDMTRDELEEMMERAAHCQEKGKVRLEEFSQIMSMKLTLRAPQQQQQ